MTFEAHRGRRRWQLARTMFVGVSAALIASCGDVSTAPVAPGFLGGTASDHQIGAVLTSLSRTLTLFQVGNPKNQQQIALGTSSTVTPTGFSIRGRRAAVPLGDAASVALVNLETSTIERFFTFPKGNTTGSAFADDTTVIAANLLENQVGRFTVGQSGDAIGGLVTVAPKPTAVTVGGGRVLVGSSNLDENYLPIGNGVVTVIDPKTMHVIGTVNTGGTNSTDAAVGPDGLLYVLNTGDYVQDGSMTIIDPATLQAVATIGDFGVGPGSITIDSNGLAYISSFAFGTAVWNTRTRQFVRTPANAVCAKLADGSCRGAFAATVNATGDVYQAFFGSPSQGLPPYIFVYQSGSYTLTDSISVGQGPLALTIRTF